MSCRSFAVAAAVLLACASAGMAGGLFDDPEFERERALRPRARPPPAQVDDPPLDEDEDEEPEADPQPPPRRRPRPDPELKFRLQHPGVDTRGPLRRLYATTIAVLVAPANWGKTEWLAFTAMTAIPGALIVTGADEDFTRLLSRDLTGDKNRVKDFGEELGTPPLAFGILGAFGIYGYFAKDDRGVQAFETGVLSAGISAGIVQVLKKVTGRARPNTGRGAQAFEPFGNDASFPSGHTALAYSLAVSINDQYPGWIGRTAYVLATTTAFARVYQLNHWTSDVIAGAAIGGATAHLVTKLNRAAREGDLRLVPHLEEDGGGLSVQKRF
jgi:hypothetical protein